MKKTTKDDRRVWFDPHLVFNAVALVALLGLSLYLGMWVRIGTTIAVINIAIAIIRILQQLDQARRLLQRERAAAASITGQLPIITGENDHESL